MDMQSERKDDLEQPWAPLRFKQLEREVNDSFDDLYDTLEDAQNGVKRLEQLVKKALFVSSCMAPR